MKDSELFAGMRELLADPKRWTKGEAARNASGYFTPPFEREAVCWCLLGAAAKVVGSDSIFKDVFNTVSCYMQVTNTSYTFTHAWNDADERTHADVLAFLDAAHEAALKREAMAEAAG
jgi:hypothetical protein